MPIFNAGRTQRPRTRSPRAASAKRCCAPRTAWCARWRTWRTRWSRSRRNGSARNRCRPPPTSAEAALGRAQSLYDRGQIDLLPLLDAQRVAACGAPVRQRQQHPAAARQRAALQGAGRRLAGVRASRPSPSASPPPPASPARRIPETRRHPRGTALKNTHATAVALAVAAMLSACSPDKPPVEAPRPVRTAEIRYDASPRSQPLCRHRAVALRGRPGLPRGRQGGAAQGRRRPVRARGRRPGRAGRHRLPARRGGRAPAMDGRRRAGPPGRIGPQAPRLI